jgi:6-pyruvoyltetrahydropterin/6-carboxytetrahydropterin synthase
MIYVTRREHFSAGHRLHNSDWTDEHNARIFGKCNNAAGHGHNYLLEVTVCGEADPLTGYVIDLKILKDVIHSRVLDVVDHRNLNVDVEFMSGVNPTAENIAVAIWNRLVDHIPSGRLFEIRLHETENNVVSYKGEA